MAGDARHRGDPRAHLVPRPSRCPSAPHLRSSRARCPECRCRRRRRSCRSRRARRCARDLLEHADVGMMPVDPGARQAASASRPSSTTDRTRDGIFFFMLGFLGATELQDLAERAAYGSGLRLKSSRRSLARPTLHSAGAEAANTGRWNEGHFTMTRRDSSSILPRGHRRAQSCAQKPVNLGCARMNLGLAGNRAGSIA